MKVLFVGGGNMGRALVGGLLAQGIAAGSIAVVEIDDASRERIANDFGVEVAGEPRADSIATYDAVVLAVKPQHLRSTAQLLAPHLATQLIISIAAGIRLDDLSRWLGSYRRVVRAMPNTPALVRRGITGLFAPASVETSERALAERIMGAVGETLWCGREQQLDAVTAVSGSGPAYLFYFLEAMIGAAEQLGFTAAEARRLAYATASGAMALAEQAAVPPATLRAQVTSKGGTTEAALAVLEQHAVKAAFVAAIQAADRRAAELGDVLGRDG